MRLVSYTSTNGPRVAGITAEGAYVDLNHANPGLPTSMTELLAMGRNGLRRAAIAITNGQPIDSTSMRLLAPVPRPEKIICVGLNYADHARESGMQPPPEPIVFNKLATTLCADGDPIVLPRLTNKVDYEAELVVVIGMSGRHISKEQALDHVAGYTCGHDVSARDWQLDKPGGQWLMGKSFDTFAPIGPVPQPFEASISQRFAGLNKLEVMCLTRHRA